MLRVHRELVYYMPYGHPSFTGACTGLTLFGSVPIVVPTQVDVVAKFFNRDVAVSVVHEDLLKVGKYWRSSN